MPRAGETIEEWTHDLDDNVICPTAKSSSGCDNWNYCSIIPSPLFLTSTGKWVKLDEWEKIELEQSITEKSTTSVIEPLPPGWFSKLSIRWGTRYYYHPETRNSQWNEPTWS
jgi:hypothetical protein